MSSDPRRTSTPDAVDVPVTRSHARSLATVAQEASELAERDVVSDTHRKLLELVGRKLASELTARSTASLFAARDGDETVATVRFEPSTLEAYLATLDAVATGSPRRHRENVCQEVFSHVTGAVDVDRLGLSADRFETLQIKRGIAFG